MTGYSQMPRIVQTSLPEISAHLWTLYWMPRMLKATIVVELGVRSGESTRALLAGCMDQRAFLWSVDIDGDAYHVRDVTENRGIVLDWTRWECRQADSVEAARQFGKRDADLLFVDTTHEYEHTLREIMAWHYRVRGAMVFHDSGIVDEEGRDGVLPAIQTFLRMTESWHIELHNNISEGDCGIAILWKNR